MIISRNGTHVLSDYPRWIERDGTQVLVKSEDDEMSLETQDEKNKMVTELEGMGHNVDLRSYKGPSGFGSLKAFYVAIINGANNGNGGNDSK